MMTELVTIESSDQQVTRLENGLLTPISTFAHRCYLPIPNNGIVIATNQEYFCSALQGKNYAVVYVIGNDHGNDIAVFSLDRHGNGSFIGRGLPKSIYHDDSKIKQLTNVE